MGDNIANYSLIDRCRSCQAPGLATILELGEHPLANSLQDATDASPPRYPLTLMFCKNCGLIQIRETVDKELLFRHYVWVTGTSFAARSFADLFFDTSKSISHTKRNDLVVEIASNDGTFLQPFARHGCRVIGVDPAKNLAKMAMDSGIPTIADFWNPDTANALIAEHGKAKFVFARNVIPHVSELHSVMEGMAASLDQGGCGAIEFHYAGIILDQLQYDSIYHEHLCYFTLETISILLKQFDLIPFHVEWSPISGGAAVIYFSKIKREATSQLTDALHKEAQEAVNAYESWKTFTVRCNAHRKKTLDLLLPYKKRRVVGFGASARSSTYLNFCRFDKRHIDAIIDNNPLKQGKFSAGTGIPIVSFQQGMDRQPDLLFVLAWNFEKEVVQQCQRAGFSGPFLVPFPNEPRVIQDASEVQCD